jgi:S1-C subfamily serine protease
MDEGVDGVGVQSVSAGTTAQKGGVFAGDVIIAWNGEDLIDVMDMVSRLRSHVPGDNVSLIVLRDGREVELFLVMQANDDVRQD